MLNNIVDRVNNIAVTSRDEVAVPSDHDVITFDLNISSCISNDNRQMKCNVKRADFAVLLLSEVLIWFRDGAFRDGHWV